MTNSQDKKSLFSTFSRVCFKSKLSFWLFFFVFLCSNALMFPCSNVSAWTPPQSPPPQDNVPQPLNTGPSPQAKIGRFTVGQSVYIPVVFGAHAPSGVDFVFTDSGYVGIGTRTPTTNLYVNGNVQSSVYYDREDDSYYLDLSGGVMPYSLLLNKGVGIGTTSPDGKLEIRQTGTADIFNLYDNTINVLTVLDGGNVGIGISAPTGLLDVNNKFVVTDEQITMNVPLNLAAAGDISIASDLQFTNPTASFIKSYGPLYLQSGDSNHSYDLTLRAFNSGEVVSDAPLNLSNNRITNLATPIDDTDAATKGYVDDIEYWQVTGSYFYPTSMDYTVGIGTTTPSVDLEIYDSGNASELLLSSDADKKSMIYFEDGQTGIYEPANSEDLRFWTGSADQMTITSDGKVGIGTTTPGAKLYVSSDSASENPLAKFQNTNSDGFARVLIDRASAGDYALLGYSTNNAINWYTGTPYQGGGQYVIGNGISLSNAKFTIDSSGNVGIGTTSPSDKLTVVMKSTTNGDGISIKAVNTGGVGSQPSLAYLNPAGSTRWAAGIDVTGDIYRIIDASQTARLVIKQGGNVGIGTTSPAYKLDIWDSSNPQLGLANTTGATTTFETNNLGNLTITPSGDTITIPDDNFKICSGGACPTTGYTIAGNGNLVVENTIVADKFEQICPTGYIYVNGSAKFGTLPGFCVMKYEAKCDWDGDNVGDGTGTGYVESTSGDCTATDTCEDTDYGTWHNDNTACTGGSTQVVSTAQGAPIAYLSQTTAQSYCEALGEGYHLISDEEWMTIAEDTAWQSENWCGYYGTDCDHTPGTVSYYLAAGHNDNRPSEAQDATTTDSLACYATVTEDTNTTCTTTGSVTQKRTHTLSNGEVIWDIAGNAWEWTDNYIVQEAGSYHTDGEMPLNSTAATTTNWYEYTVVTNYKSVNYIKPFRSDWSSTQRIGKIYLDYNGAYTTGDDQSDYHAFLRGGGWSDTSYAGVFTLYLDFSPSTTYCNIGFRCAR